MKNILLLRHANSPADRSMQDFDRPLDGRGEREALLMGRLLALTGQVPARIISSPAERAGQTTRRVVGQLEIDPSDISWMDELYSGSVMDYVKVIRQLPDEVERVLVVGHNPLVEQTISEFCGSTGDVAVRMATAALACIEHPSARWEMVLPGTSRLQWLVSPDMAEKLVSGENSR